MRIFNIVFILVFLLFAALQYNDPDPYIWIPMYVYGAVLCFLALRKKYKFILYIIGLVVYAGYSIYLFFDKNGVLNWVREHNAENIARSMKATKPWIEETREFGGLIILIVVLLINLIWLKKMNNYKCNSFKRALP